MAKETKDKNGGGGSMTVIALSALLALGAAGGVYYCYGEAEKAESDLNRAKGEYKKMAEWKKPVEDFLRKNKGKPAAAETNEDMMVFLDRKARESQIATGSITFSKTPPINLSAWTETVYTATLTGKDPVKKNPIVDFLRKVESERRTTKVKTLQLQFSGDDFKNATITFSQFAPK
jgi:hypothetical protein